MRQTIGQAVIIGRKQESLVLENLYHSKQAEFIALYGRRRIGKTYLIKQYFSKKKDCFFFRVTGVKNANIKTQLSLFTRKLEESFYPTGLLALKEPVSWLEGFDLLNRHLDEQVKEKKIILFFDELPWLATRKSNILEALDYFWNTKWSENAKIKLIVCGSAAAWMLKNIVRDKGGLHNRLTYKMRLEPFTLSETKEYLLHKKIRFQEKQLVDLYMVTGGVPYYLSYVQKGLSSHQVIDELCFSKEGPLVNEFQELFSSLFDKSEAHQEIIQVLAEHKSGLDRSTLAEKIRLSSGGWLNSRLSELEEAGFILAFFPYLNERRGVYYKIIDEYTLFYLRWIAPISKGLKKQSIAVNYWLAKSKTPEYLSWAGYAFEMICFKHIKQITLGLQIPSGADVGSWRYKPIKAAEEGAQIDLLFDRLDNTITLCEIKYNTKPYSINKEYMQKLTRKIEVFKRVTRTNKQILLSFITVCGLAPNLYADDYVDSSITLDALFVE